MLDPNQIPYWQFHPDYRPGKVGDAIRRLIPTRVRLRKYPLKSASNTKAMPKQLSLFELSKQQNMADHVAPMEDRDSAT